MSEVLLLNQYYTSSKDAQEFIAGSIPINLLYLGTYLKERGIDCSIAELGAQDMAKVSIINNRYRCGLSDEEIRDVLSRHKPKIVGIGCMFTRHYPDVLALARLVKAADPSIRVVLGGNHVTSFPEQILGEPAVDYIVMGEGEVTFHELCSTLLAGGEVSGSIKGLAFRDSSGKVVQTQKRELIKNLDTINCDYDMVDVNRYAAMSINSPFLMRYPSLAITTSRGCPGNCVYCTVKSVYGRTWRGKSPKKTVDEIEFLHRKYGIREFAFLDDSASVDRIRWNGICEEITARKLDIRWMTPNGIAHWTLDRQTLDKMKKSGCYRITFGIESGNVETRKYLGKPYPLEQARDMLEHANRIGMWTICTNIIGFPYETREMIKDTVDFAVKSGTDFATFFLLVPHITSDVYKDFKKEGLLDLDPLFSGKPFSDEEYERMATMINDGGTSTKCFTGDELKLIQMAAYRKFIFRRAMSYLLNPLRLTRKIKSYEDFLYMVKLLGIGFSIFARSFRKMTTKKLLYSKLATK